MPCSESTNMSCNDCQVANLTSAKDFIVVKTCGWDMDQSTWCVCGARHCAVVSKPWTNVKAPVFCNVTARSRHFVNVDVIFLPSVCDSFCVSTFSLGQRCLSFCRELYEQSTIVFCRSGRDACLTIVCTLCPDHVFWYPWFLWQEFNSFVHFLVCMQT